MSNIIYHYFVSLTFPFKSITPLMFSLTETMLSQLDVRDVDNASPQCQVVQVPSTLVPEHQECPSHHPQEIAQLSTTEHQPSPCVLDVQPPLSSLTPTAIVAPSQKQREDVISPIQHVSTPLPSQATSEDQHATTCSESLQHIEPEGSRKIFDLSASPVPASDEHGWGAVDDSDCSNSAFDHPRKKRRLQASMSVSPPLTPGRQEPAHLPDKGKGSAQAVLVPQSGPSPLMLPAGEDRSSGIALRLPQNQLSMQRLHRTLPSRPSTPNVSQSQVHAMERKTTGGST